MPDEPRQRVRIAWCGDCGNVSVDGINFQRIEGGLQCAGCGSISPDFEYLRRTALLEASGEDLAGLLEPPGTLQDQSEGGLIEPYGASTGGPGESQDSPVAYHDLGEGWRAGFVGDVVFVDNHPVVRDARAKGRIAPELQHVVLSRDAARKLAMLFVPNVSLPTL